MNSSGVWERQALCDIESRLDDSDPTLASLLAIFGRLTSSEEMPVRKKIRALRHPPRRRRRPHRRARQRRPQLSRPRQATSPPLVRQRAALLMMSMLVVFVVAMTAVAVVLSHGGTSHCAEVWPTCGS